MRSHCPEHPLSSGRSGIIVGNILLGIGIPLRFVILASQDLPENTDVGKGYSGHGDIDGLRVKFLSLSCTGHTTQEDRTRTGRCPTRVDDGEHWTVPVNVNATILIETLGRYIPNIVTK